MVYNAVDIHLHISLCLIRTAYTIPLHITMKKWYKFSLTLQKDNPSPENMQLGLGVKTTRFEIEVKTLFSAKKKLIYRYPESAPIFI